MFFDIGIGIILAWLTSELFGVDFSFGLILFGVAASLLPDLDTLFHLKSGKEVGSHKGHDHRDLWHYPLIYIPLGAILISFFSSHYAFLFAVASLVHFLHDSVGIGWGVQWLYPFSTRHFSFLYHYDVNRNNLPKKLIYNWRHDEVDKLSDQYGDRDWVKNVYLSWHPYAIIEFLVFVIAIGLLAYLLL
jgi:hypothetical protein